MGEVRVIEIKENIMAANEAEAAATRESLGAKGTFFVNFMSAPGSGKTSVISALINMLKDRYRIGEMDVDIESSLDAEKVRTATGIETLQIHNMGLCHIDAEMTARALAEYYTEGLDLLLLEDIGNLVCPAEFDTGAHRNVMLISVPEGDDKPHKYPLMFSIADLVLVTKTDALGYFDFDLEALEDRVRMLNPDVEIMRVCVKTGEGLEKLASWIEGYIGAVKSDPASVGLPRIAVH